MNNQVKIILVEPSHQGNIGAIARSMKNMGFNNLCLVNPKNPISKEAYDRAAGAGDLLDNCEIQASLEDALDNCVYVTMTTARVRHSQRTYIDSRSAASLIHEHQKKITDKQCIALVFGPERTGLSNLDLDKSHSLIYIPTTEFSSLNLSMAVNLMCYEMHMASLIAKNEISNTSQSMPKTHSEPVPSAEQASQKEMEAFYEHYQEVLTSIDFFKGKKPENLMRKLRHIYQRCYLTLDEVHILRGIFSRTTYQVGKTKK